MTESEIRQAAQRSRLHLDFPLRTSKKEGAVSWEGQVEWKWPAQPEHPLAEEGFYVKPIYFGPAGKMASVNGKGPSASQEPSKWVESHSEWGDAS